MFLLEARAVSKIYRGGTPAEVRALDDVSLAIAPGTFGLFTGASGSGKTTLLALLGALDRPTSGSVLYAGRDLSRCSDVELARVRRRFGFIFQNFALLPGLPVWENVTYPLIPRGVSQAQRHQLAGEHLARLGLEHRRNALPSELSGGEQQRVAAARALAGGPEVILADEPTSNLDDAAATTLIDLLRQLHTEGKTILVSSHDVRLRELATSVYELEAGRLNPEDRRPKTED